MIRLILSLVELEAYEVSLAPPVETAPTVVGASVPLQPYLVVLPVTLAIATVGEKPVNQRIKNSNVQTILAQINPNNLNN